MYEMLGVVVRASSANDLIICWLKWGEWKGHTDTQPLSDTYTEWTYLYDVYAWVRSSCVWEYEEGDSLKSWMLTTSEAGG